MRCLVTGCAGFIGSHLTDRLLQAGHTVVGVDNLSTGRLEFLREARQSPQFSFIEADLLDKKALTAACKTSDIVFHLAANADVRFGTSHPDKDLQQNTIATFHVLEAMRLNGIKRIVFASTGSIYGESPLTPTPEDAPFPVQTSLYGASKLAAEGLIQAYCEGFAFQAFIFRFVSILGERYTHGHVFDFYKQLKDTPQQLHILGDGTQRKSYLYVQDCLDAILLALEKSPHNLNIFNLGVEGFCEINESVQWICEALQVSPSVSYGGGKRGWIGDNPFIFLDTQKIQSLGWRPRYTIQEGVMKTVQYLRENEWVLVVR